MKINAVINDMAVEDDKPAADDLLRGDDPPTKIVIIGVGGGGGNAVDNLIRAKLTGVKFVAVNTDLQALKRCLSTVKLAIGAKVTKGLGAGGIPERGEKAAQESAEEIKEVLRGADMVFITAGMGGGTGTGAAPVIAQIAKEMGILTLALVTRPFTGEGKRKLKFADEGIKKLEACVDSSIVINTQDVMDGDGRDLPIMDALALVDDVLVKGVSGISEIITKTEHINIDFSDVETVMRDQGRAFLGIGVASGENRAAEAAARALNHPMLKNVSLDGAKNILITVISDPGLTVREYDDIVRLVTVGVSDDAMRKSGFLVDPEFKEGIQVTVVAAGIDPGTAAAQASSCKQPEQTSHDVVPYEEWIKMQEGLSRGTANMFLSGRNSSDSDLGIPAVLRAKKDLE
ncbi:MAG: cell division protein FtsZ [Spirochaetales bacterium]|jgi:cell division protein FtsZ|nr:cell division protein FtsZ [Spirochaetales bacterium]